MNVKNLNIPSHGSGKRVPQSVNVIGGDRVPITQEMDIGIYELESPPRL